MHRLLSVQNGEFVDQVHLAHRAKCGAVVPGITAVDTAVLPSSAGSATVRVSESASHRNIRATNMTAYCVVDTFDPAHASGCGSEVEQRY